MRSGAKGEVPPAVMTGSVVGLGSGEANADSAITPSSITAENAAVQTPYAERSFRFVHIGDFTEFLPESAPEHRREVARDGVARLRSHSKRLVGRLLNSEIPFRLVL
jgi:hypothetical protein